MIAERFNLLLQHPDQLSTVSHAELVQAVKVFPYCQNLRILMYQKSMLHQHTDLANHARTAAVYCNDRSHFYHNNQMPTVRKEEIDAQQMAENFLEKTERHRRVVRIGSRLLVPAKEQRSEEPALKLVVDRDDHRPEELEDITHEIPKIQAMEGDDPNFNLNEQLKKFLEENDVPEEKEPLPFHEKKDRMVFLEDLITEENDQDAPPKLLEEPTVTEPEEVVHSDEQLLPEESTPSEEVSTPPAAPIDPRDIPMEITNLPNEHMQQPPSGKPLPKESFSSWLKKFKSPQIPVEAKKVETKKKKKQKPGNEKKKKKKKIKDFAAKSLKEGDVFASQTYAEILVKQEAYEKAIQIYERLKLIYPEKSSFFASRIEELKKNSID